MVEGSSTSFSLGIEALDKRGLGAFRGQLHLFLVSGIGQGKTWWLVNAGAKALTIDHAKVLFVSVEMSEANLFRRYVQAFYGVTTSRDHQPRMIIKRDAEGNFAGVREAPDFQARCLDDQETVAWVIQRQAEDRDQLNRLLIKEFPSGSLTLPQLNAYLDSLARDHDFVPDLILVDNVGMLRLSVDKHWVDLEAAYRDLRKIAVDRNCAVMTVGEDWEMIRRETAMDDFERRDQAIKMQAADTILSYDQFSEEYEKGLARLVVKKAPGATPGDAFRIVQHYATGQFCVECEPLSR